MQACLGFPGGSVVNNPPANAGAKGLIPGSGSFPGEGNGNPLQCSWGESQGRGSLVGCHLWGHTESDTTKATYQQQQQLFTLSGPSIEASVQPQSFQWIFRIDFLQDWLVWSPCSPWDFQESSPTPQSKSISSSALSLLYGPIFTSIHDYWKNHSFD